MMADEFHLTRYQFADREAVFAFLREAFPPADGARLIRQWQWKYDANPFNHDGRPHVVLLKTGPRLVGMNGRLFFPVAVDGAAHLAHHGCDLVVHPAYRGRGLSQRLRVRDQLDSVIHFSWQNEASYQVAKRDGTAGLPYVTLVRPLDAARIIGRLLGDGRISQALGATVRGALQARARWRRAPVAPEVRVESLGEFDERFDRLWEQCRRDYRVMIVRDRRYLQWRFAQRPDAGYTILAATAGSAVAGYMVTRCATREGRRLGYLVDFLVRDRSARTFAALIEHAVDGLRREGATAVVCAVSVPPYRRMLYRHGFVRWPGAPRGYFRGWVRDPALRSVGDVRQWFLTMGDGDLEMSF